MSRDEFATQAVGDEPDKPAPGEQSQDDADNHGKPKSASSEPQPTKRRLPNRSVEWFEKGVLNPTTTEISLQSGLIRRVFLREKAQLRIKYTNAPDSKVDQEDPTSPVPAGRYLKRFGARRTESERPLSGDTGVLRADQSINSREAAPGGVSLADSPDVPRSLVRFHASRMRRIEDMSLRVVEFSGLRGLPESLAAHAIIRAIRRAVQSGRINPQLARVKHTSVVHNSRMGAELVVRVGFYHAQGAREVYDLGDEGVLEIGGPKSAARPILFKMSLCRDKDEPDANTTPGPLRLLIKEVSESQSPPSAENLVQGSSRADDLTTQSKTEEEEGTEPSKPLDGSDESDSLLKGLIPHWTRL